MSTEKRIIAEGKKLDALRERIRATKYLTASEVREHLHMSRDSLDSVPFEVLPWVPGNGAARVVRRYHPADVAAYPARARRWRDGIDAGAEAETLKEMRDNIEARDARLISDSLESYAA